MRQLIKQILKEESNLKQKLRDLVDKFGFASAIKVVGGQKNFVKILYDDNKLEFVLDYLPELLGLRRNWTARGESFTQPGYGFVMKKRHNSDVLYLNDKFYKQLSPSMSDNEILTILNKQYGLNVKEIFPVSLGFLQQIR